MQLLYHAPFKTILLGHSGRSHPMHTSGNGMWASETGFGLAFTLPVTTLVDIPSVFFSLQVTTFSQR